MRGKTTLWAGPMILVLVGVAFAGTPGSLDATFGDDGVVLTATDQGELLGVAAQSDGSIIAVGHDPNTSWVIRRYGSDGTLDTDFEDDADPGLTGIASDVAVDANGRIVVVGWVRIEETTTRGKKTTTTFSDHLAVLRLNADGTPDTTFGDGGLVLTDHDSLVAWQPPKAVALQSDGRIVVSALARVVSDDGGKGGGGGGGNGGGKGKKSTTTQDTSTTQEAIAILRYEAGGDLDTSFGDGGIVVDDVTTGDDGPMLGALVIQSTGEIVVGGGGLNGAQALYLRRYGVSGTVDGSFGDGGIATLSGHVLAISGLAVDGTDRLLCGGADADWTHGVVVRFDHHGVLDDSFAGDGVFATDLTTTSFIGPVHIESDGAILAGGHVWAGDSHLDGIDAFVVRLDDDGTLDATFGTGGYSDVSTPGDLYIDNAPFDMVVVDGDPVIAGTRFLPDTGIVDWLLVRWCGN